MKIQKIKFNNQNKKYSIFIGNKILKILPTQVRLICPDVKKIALIFDSKIPLKYKRILAKSLRKYELTFLSFSSSEKSKSMNSVNYFLNKLLAKNFNRSDLIIGVGGGILGDLSGFVSKILIII